MEVILRQEEIPEAVREEETEKKMTCGENRKEDRNRERKKIRRKVCRLICHRVAAQKTVLRKEAAAYEVMVKNRIDSGIQSGVLSGRFGTDIKEKGILEIYGTTNRLTNIYFIIGGMFLILGVFLYCLKK